ncbi:UDP-glycosyltransferase UGT5-like [Athalia rosae]|uniref:UDP-glycosyltransferase UGT5-like n=1 Tax=Athalia rosae TaxID=37344 RepID=UPI0020348253|nr:UDP-glycosyltransferase UGT5-like [Athalia rosae]
MNTMFATDAIVYSFAICFLSLLQFGNGYRILSICSRASFSHQIVFRGLTLALNKRGHEIVAITTDPMNDPKLKNYTEIDVSHLYKSNLKVNIADFTDWPALFPDISEGLNLQTVEIFEHPDFKKLYAANANEKFDLILLELLYWPAFYPLAKRFDAPIIGMTPMAGLTINIKYSLGDPMLPSHPSNWEIYTADQPQSFWRRLVTFFSFWKFLYYYKTLHTKSQEAIAKKYLGPDIPDLSELETNVSLVFVNRRTSATFAEPNVPKIINIGSFHLDTRTDKLPQRLGEFLNDSENGFIYMSLGTNMKSTMLSSKVREALLSVFSRLPFKVLWKFEDESLPGLPPNVFIMKWVPQQAVLAHPNLKAFIYQGGVQSTEEAISNAVPLIGIPTWADQKMQIDKLVSLGVARKLEVAKLDEKSLVDAITAVTLDSSYKENMVNLRKRWIDNSQDLLENGIWWTEHIIRHRGGSHLHCIIADTPWYQRQDMDLIAFISSGCTLVSIFLLFLLYRLLSCVSAIRRYNSAETKRKTS